DEIARPVAVLFKEMFPRDLERLIHAFTNGDGRHHDNELGEAVAPVQFEHRLDVAISFPRSRLHLDVQVDRRGLAWHQRRRLGQAVPTLDSANVLQEVSRGELDLRVAKTEVSLEHLPEQPGIPTRVDTIPHGSARRLTVQAIDYGVHCINLV